MNGVYCFSATGRTWQVAQVFAEALKVQVTAIQGAELRPLDTAVVVFPVYCQNIPEPVREFMPRLQANNLVLVAAYGRMHHGNVLWEAEKLTNCRLTGAAYVPMGHTYLDEPADVDWVALAPLLRRIQDPKPVKLPRQWKNPLADLAPRLRGQMGVSLGRKETCNQCGLCTSLCPVGAMRNGVPGKDCIRCLGCVTHCPQNALDVRFRWPLRLYLRKRKKNQTILYL